MKKFNKYLIGIIFILIVIIASGTAYIVGSNSTRNHNEKQNKITRVTNNKEDNSSKEKTKDTTNSKSKENNANSNEKETHTSQPTNSSQDTSNEDPAYIANHYPENSPEYQAELQREKNNPNFTPISAIDPNTGKLINPAEWQQRAKSMTNDTSGPKAENGLPLVKTN